MQITKIIPPQWKRKHKIIIKAHFPKLTKKEQEELDKKLAMTLWNMWLFDDVIKENKSKKE